MRLYGRAGNTGCYVAESGVLCLPEGGWVPAARTVTAVTLANVRITIISSAAKWRCCSRLATVSVPTVSSLRFNGTHIARPVWTTVGAWGSGKTGQ